MAQKKVKIFFCIPNLSAGGAERVMVFLAKNLSSKLFTVKLIVVGFEKDSVYSTAGIDVCYLNETKVRKAFFKIFRILKEYEPDILFGTLAHINQLVGLLSYLFPRLVCVTRETYVLSEDRKTELKKPYFKRVKNRFITKLANNRINYIICQSNDMQNDILQTGISDSKKLKVLNNPVSNEIQVKKVQLLESPIKFITVGRLTKQKGHDRILRCLSKITFDFTYTIIGDGPKKKNLLDLAKNLGISDKIIHIPFTDKVYEQLYKHHIYLQGSYYEGFPNALLESLGSGTPAIVFEAPGGINEIMSNDSNGFIVENEHEFIKKINYVKDNLSEFSPSKVSKIVREKFGSDIVIRQYEDFFNQIVT
ncbi:glycosyltransferase [Muricauda sp. TY007]|uniref:glycosyltransferase n=1 Tax=Allomuricauda sp. TY007 TaxID=2683200 RepID=UPI0013C047D6|nr:MULTISPECIES: glycosyltransferase [unclassified Allomuricauda]MBA4744728.1 glycosyltransferase [Allomuricauda sp.]NDV17313.1 glycosyltransferase [Muricauda sp. TY007]